MGEYPSSKVISLLVYSSRACLLRIILLWSFCSSILSAAFILQKLEETSENRIPCDRYFSHNAGGNHLEQETKLRSSESRVSKLHSVSFISFSAFRTATTVLLGSQTQLKKEVKAFAKYDWCLYKGLCVLVSTAKCMCTLITQDSVSKFSAFSTCITRKFKHHQISHMCEKKTYQSNQNP